MKRDRLTISSVLAAVSLSLVWSGDAAADWPVARHDAQRTGTATGKSDITIPVAFWRYYLGGFIGAPNLRIFDVDGDGTGEVVVVSGGRALAKELSDETRWESPALELDTMDGLADLDGDGKVELIAHSTDRTYVIEPTDGRVLWSEPVGEMGTIGGVRIGDVNGDGVDDLLIGECGCCSVRSGTPGVVYSFAGNITAPSLLWTFPIATCGGTSGPFTLLDLDGKPGLEVVLGESDRLSVVDGKTGAVVAASAPFGTKIQRSRCMGLDLDGSAGDELVCVMSVSDPPATNQRRAFALTYNASPTPSFDLLWSTTLAPDAGELRWVDPFVDLDGDGRFEVVTSRKTVDGKWTTVILAAESGSVIATIPNSITRGVAYTLAGGGAVLLTGNGADLTGWRVARASTPAVSQMWTIPSSDVLLEEDPGERVVSSLATHVLTVDANGDGNRELLVRSLSGPPTITAYSTTTNVASVARFVLPTDRDLVRAWSVAPNQKLGVLAVLQDDGLVRILGQGLVPIASSDDVAPAGLRFGGYSLTGGWRDLQDTMIAGQLNPSEPDAVVVRDSRGALIRLDAANASFASPPRVLWSRKDSFSPAIVPKLAGDSPGIACFGYAQPVTQDPDYVISALNGDGSARWSVAAPKRPYNDILPGRFNGDSTPDLVFEWGNPGDQLVSKRAVSGANGTTIWDSNPILAGSGRQPAGIAVGQWDADGLDDVYHQTGATRVISGATGAELAASGVGPPYFQPILANLDADPRSEVVLQGGAAPARALDDRLTSVLWQSSDADRPYPYGALITCPDGIKVLVEGSQLNAARLKVTTLSGASLGTEATVVLAGGQSYPDESQAIADGRTLSHLGSVAAHTDLGGTGEPMALVGSGDGWLYAYRPCSGTLAFVYHVGSPVGSPIFADTDGDGKDEVLVSAADGYLYALRDLAIAAPGYVWDTDPDAGIIDRDVNSITTRDHLSARWRDVPGATSYEVTVVTLDGTYLTSPAWTDVGNVVQTTLPDLPLQDGAAYRFAVRAIGSEGRSVDTVSNGVVVRFPVGADAGAGDAGPETEPSGGCHCRAGATASDVLGGLFLLFAVALALRRRAR